LAKNGYIFVYLCKNILKTQKSRCSEEQEDLQHSFYILIPAQLSEVLFCGTEFL